MNGNVMYTSQPHTWLKAYNATGNFGKKYLPTCLLSWPVKAALSKQMRNQGSSPPLHTNTGIPRQDRGEEIILLFHSTRKLHLTLPVLTTTSQTPTEWQRWYTAQEPTLSFVVMANCQNLCPNEHAQHLTGLLGELRPPTLIRGVENYFSPLAFLFIFFQIDAEAIPVDLEARVKEDKIAYKSQKDGIRI